MHAETAERAPPPLVINLSVALLCLLWGSTWVVIAEGLDDLPPFTSASARFLVAFATLTAIAPWLSRREGGTAPPAWLWLTLGVTNFAMSYGVVYVCTQSLPSGLVSVLWAVFPLIMAASGHLFLDGERLVPRNWLGFAIGFAGVVLLFATDLRQFGPSGVPLALLLLVSPLSAAFGTTLIKRYGSRSSSVLLNRNAIGVGAAILLGIAIAFERDAEVAWTGPAILSVVYLAVAGTVVTFGLYFWLMRYRRANRLALIAFVTPCVALVLGWTFRGEPVTAYTLCGTVCVVIGVALAVLRPGGRSRRPQ
jgi:drug/metabolite transporter (DMT)-like permease